MPKQRKGNQTPTQSRLLSIRNSKFKDAVEIYERSGHKAQRWQINLMKAILSQNR